MLEAFSRRHPGAGKMIMSGYPDAVRYASLGASHIAKPFAFTELLEKIAAALPTLETRLRPAAFDRIMEVRSQRMHCAEAHELLRKQRARCVHVRTSLHQLRDKLRDIRTQMRQFHDVH